MRIAAIILLCCTAFGCDRLSAEQRAKRDFDHHFAQWRAECRQPKIRILSDVHAFTELPSFRAIVALGRSALPYIIEKMQDDRYSELALAVVEINGWQHQVHSIEAVSTQEYRDEVLARTRSQK